MTKPSPDRVNLVSRSHYGVRPTAFQHWNGFAPQMQAAPESNEILLYGLILPHEEVTFLRDCFGDETAMSGKMFREALEKIEGDVVLRINSDGGDVFEAAVMVQALRERQEGEHKVLAVIDGIAASAATLLTSAADEVTIAEMGFLMIHQAGGGAYGLAEDLERGAKVLRDINDSAATLYVERTGMSYDEIVAMMDAETYLAAADAVEKGFADAVAKGPGRQPRQEPAMTRRNERLAAILSAVNSI